MTETELDLTALVPGGILETDHVHVSTNDGSCSRCRKAPDDDQVPLLLWSSDAKKLLIYCQDCQI